jgi:HrpA-like RNA helicase
MNAGVEKIMKNSTSKQKYSHFSGVPHTNAASSNGKHLNRSKHSLHPSNNQSFSKKSRLSTHSSNNSSRFVPSGNPNNDPKNLPVYLYEKEIIHSLNNFQVTIIVGETGSGKSTQIPQILLNNNLVNSDSCLVCTQPRRVAAVTIAQKVASERRCEVGKEVGYSIRFEDKSSPITKIKYVTDGVLLREIMSDSLLSKYNIVILDEAHERSMQTDILMGLLKILIEIQKLRTDLKVIIMSATLQIELFSSFFTNSNCVIIPGRQYAVSMFYTPEPEAEYVDAALITCLQVAFYYSLLSLFFSVVCLDS